MLMIELRIMMMLTMMMMMMMMICMILTTTGFMLEGESIVYDDGDNVGADDDDDDDDDLFVGRCDINDDMALILFISVVFARSDRQTDIVDYRDARTHLKKPTRTIFSGISKLSNTS